MSSKADFPKIRVVGYHKCIIPEIKKIVEDLVSLYNSDTKPYLLKVESARKGTYYTRYETYTKKVDIYATIEASLPAGCTIQTLD